MSTRYDDRDDDRSRRNYGGRSGQDYDRSYNQSSQGYGRYFDDEDARYAGESRWRGQFGTGRNLYGGGGDFASSRNWGSAGEDDRDYATSRNRPYGSSGRGGYSGGGYSGGEYGGESGRSRGEYGRSGGGYEGSSYGDEYGSNYGGGLERGEGRYRDTQGGYSQRYNYPSGYRSGERYGERGRYGDYGRHGDYGRGEYGGRGGRYEGRSGYEGRAGYAEGEERGWWDRFSDTVASWFGDEEAERRRQMERPYRGRGPKGYRRSDERIREDVNDRLSEGYLDATEIEVSVSNGEVMLSGTVDSRADKRRAEDIAENVSGVTNVENRLRVRQQMGATYRTSEGTSTMGTGATGTTGTTAATDTSTGATGTSAGSSTATGTTSARGKSASS